MFLIPSAKEMIVGDVAAVGNWVIANVRSSVAWPLKIEAVEFRGHTIFLGPRTSATVVANGNILTMYPFVAVNLPAGMAYKAGRQLLSHFLSSLSWAEGGGIAVEHWSSGSRMHPMGENRTAGVGATHFETDYLPDPIDQRTRWALAFYREGLSLERDNVAYAALSYFKILNIVADNSPKQKAWINAHISDFGSNNYNKMEIKQRVAELNRLGTNDIGAYLYVSCRCAVAHAGVNPTVDPEDSDDLERLHSDISLIRAMAAHVIEKELGVKSRSTIWNEHLYELAGFQQLAGPALTARLKAADATLVANDLSAFPRMTVRIKDAPSYAALEDLSPVVTAIAAGRVDITLSSDDRAVQVDLALSFTDERMKFDAEVGLRVADNGSEDCARRIVSVLQFLTDYYGNGKLQIFDSTTGNLLGRKDAYLPVNVVPSAMAEHLGQLIVKYEGEAEARAAQASGEVANP